jgi:hypothetical protein
LAGGKAGIGSQSTDFALDVEDGVDPFHRFQRNRRDLMGRFALADVARDVGQFEEFPARMRPAQRWSWFFDQFYAAQRSGMVFISRSKFRVWFSISINLVRGHQTVG